MDSLFHYVADPNSGYYLENKLELLDTAGEWFFDKTNNRLYIKTFQSDSPAIYNVEATAYSSIIDFSTTGSSDYKFIDIAFDKSETYGIDGNVLG